MESVTVIIPNYNHALFLKQRIDSVLNQTYQDFELIILDDCSTDNSQEIINEYKNHPKVKNIVFNKENSGSTFFQWEKGIRLADTEFIWIAESDDYNNKHFLDTCIKAFREDDEIVLCYCRTMQINDIGKELGINLWADDLDNKRWKHNFISTGISEINNYLRFRNTIPNASAVVFKKTNAITVLGEITKRKMKFCGDWFFWCHILLPGKVVYIPKLLNFQRYHDQTTRKIKSNETEIERIREYKFCITAISTIVNKKVNWLNKKYDWIFDEYLDRITLKNRYNKMIFTNNKIDFLLKLLQVEFKLYLKRSTIKKLLYRDTDFYS